MSRILISGYYGFANAGDEAMLSAIIKALQGAAANKELQLRVISGNPQATARVHGVDSVHRFHPWQLLRSIMDCDLLLSGGGSLLQDVTSKRSLLYYLSVLLAGRLLGKRVMLYAQGIGPINSPWLRRLTSKICNAADLITVRDMDSLQELRRLGVQEARIRLTADAVLTLKREPLEAGRSLLQRCGVEAGSGNTGSAKQKLIAISVRQWQQDEGYLHQLAQAADKLVLEHKAQLLLLPLQYPADVAACRKVQQLMNQPSTVLDVSCTTEEFLSVIGNCQLLIGMRLHALIFAAVMGVPFAAVSYDPKIDGFVKEINGLSAGNMQNLHCEAIVQAANKALSQQDRCQQRLQELREKSLLNAQLAWSLLGNS